MSDREPTLQHLLNRAIDGVVLHGEADHLRRLVAELEKDAATLAALHAAGVDNWDGYEAALDAQPTT